MTTDQDGAVGVVEFYWRPGCPFCERLIGPLRASGLPLREINIWEDPDGAARVRTAAHGNETVPTVIIGNYALVNPSYKRVEAAVREHAPELAQQLPEEKPRRFGLFRRS